MENFTELSLNKDLNNREININTPESMFVDERANNIDEKSDSLNNGILNETKDIAKEAKEAERLERINALEQELGVPDTASEEKGNEDEIIEKDFGERLDKLEIEIKSLTLIEIKIIKAESGDKVAKDWEFKQSGKMKISFLRMMLELMDGKPLSLKKIVLMGEYLKERLKKPGPDNEKNSKGPEN